MHAHSHMTWAPVADNVFLIALPLNCVISPCRADNLRSRGADMPRSMMAHLCIITSTFFFPIEIKLFSPVQKSCF